MRLIRALCLRYAYARGDSAMARERRRYMLRARAWPVMPP